MNDGQILLARVGKSAELALFYARTYGRFYLLRAWIRLKWAAWEKWKRLCLRAEWLVRYGRPWPR